MEAPVAPLVVGVKAIAIPEAVEGSYEANVTELDWTVSIVVPAAFKQLAMSESLPLAFTT